MLTCVDDSGDEDGVAESDKVDFAQWSLDYHVEPDDIIKQLVKEASGETDKEAEIMSDDVTAHVHEIDGYAFVSCKKDVDGMTSEPLLTADSYHAVASVSNSDTSDDASHLKRLLTASPQVYKHCILEIEQHYKVSAVPRDRSLSRIHIHASDRGRTFHGDDVVVKICSRLLSQSASVQSKDEKVWGKVVGVLKHMIDPKCRMFVCHVDSNISGLMVPTDLAVPKISSLKVQERSKEELKGRICVYTVTKQKKIKFHHFEMISSASDRKLFVVKFLSWREGFRYPLGVVIGTTPVGTTAADAINILSIEYFIPQLYQTATENEVKQLYPLSWKNFPPAALNRRADYRDSLVFTIDGPSVKDLDDAMSVVEHSDCSCTVRVHIADVAYFVEKGNSIDEEACVRGMSHYPAIGCQTNMLSARLSENLCSLIPGVDRLTITVSAKISADCDVKSVTVERSVVRSQHQLTYSFVEHILAGSSPPDVKCPQPLKHDLLLLEKVSKNLRHRRLGDSYSNLSSNAERFEYCRAGLLVEELMIFANYHVAKHLTEVYPKCTPIRVQSAPDSQDLELWKKMFVDEQKNMFALSPLLENDGYHSESHDTSSAFTVSVLQPLWKALSTEDAEVEKLFEVIRNPAIHSQLSVALLHYRRIADRSKFVSSGEVSRDQWRHCAQNLPVYTNFTSPLRRYVDLVVQRLLIAAINGQPCPYSHHEIVDICIRCSDASVRGSGFEKASKVASLCLLLQDHPVCSYAFVEKLSPSKLSLSFPPLNFIFPWSLLLHLSALKLSTAPVLAEKQLHLSWSERLYELMPLRTAPCHNDEPRVIDVHQHVVNVAATSWQEMLRATAMHDTQALHAAIAAAQKVVIETPRYATELTSEGRAVETKKQFCEFSLAVHQSSVLLMQMSVELHKGILRPCIQLLHLTPQTSICVEHNMKPVQCFATVPSQSAIKERYASPQQYQTLWLPLLQAEAALSALTESSSSVIHNVKITWTEKGGCRYGTFKISMLFCTERQIKFGGVMEASKVNKTGMYIHDVKRQASSGYMCVRYSSRNSTGMADLLAVLSSEVSASSTAEILWVGHCIVTGVIANSKKQLYEVQLQLSHSSTKFPNRLLSDDCPLATVEWLTKLFPDV